MIVISSATAGKSEMMENISKCSGMRIVIQNSATRYEMWVYYMMLLGNVMFQNIKFRMRGLGVAGTGWPFRASMGSQGLNCCVWGLMSARVPLWGCVGEGISPLLQLISVRCTKPGYVFTYLWPTALDRVKRPFRSLIMLTRHSMTPFVSGSSPTLRATAMGCPFIIVPLSSRAFRTDLGLANMMEAYRLKFGSQWA